MTTNQTTITAAHQVHYIGDPRSAAAKTATLSGAGPLQIAKDHVAAKMLPDAVGAGATDANKIINMRDVMMVISPFIIYDDTVSNGGMHFSVKVEWLSALFAHLSARGVEWKKIDGDWGAAYGKVADVLEEIRLLPADKRTVTREDVLYATSDDDDPGTGGWFDYVTPAMLIEAGDGSTRNLGYFQSIITNNFNNGDEDALGGRLHRAGLCGRIHRPRRVGV